MADQKQVDNAIEYLRTLAEVECDTDIHSHVAGPEEREEWKIADLIESLNKEIEQCHARSVCCCGDYVKQHTQGHGHLPVSMYDYALDSALQEVENLKRVGQELLEVMDCDGPETVDDLDDDSVGWTGDGEPLSMTFGHIRRFRDLVRE